jgi:hypothetical protein
MHETPYDSEALLQRLLAEYSNLLSGDQINPDNAKALAAGQQRDARLRR